MFTCLYPGRTPAAKAVRPYLRTKRQQRHVSRCRHRHYATLKCPLSVLLRFTALIADRAACLARGLAGRLAFAASAFFDCILKILRVQSLNMLHLYILLYQRVQLNKRR